MADVFAPVIAGVLMLVVLVLGVTNFNVLITSSTTAPTDAMSIVLPLILLLAGIAGMVVAAAIRARDPERYARIGERTEVELAELRAVYDEYVTLAEQQPRAIGVDRGRSFAWLIFATLDGLVLQQLFSGRVEETKQTLEELRALLRAAAAG